jgi:hypothetical protein
MEKDLAGLNVTPDEVTFMYQHLTEGPVEGQIEEYLRNNPDVEPFLNGYPSHIRFYFEDSKYQELVFPREPNIFIFPRLKYRGMFTAAHQKHFDEQINLLEAIISKPEIENVHSVPVLPIQANQQMFSAKRKNVAFQRYGMGVSFVTQFGNVGDEVKGDELVYVYQGRTNDKRYYVSVYYPVTTNSIPEKLKKPSVEQLTDSKLLLDYQSNLEKGINQIPNDAFNPPLNQVDTMVNSIEIHEDL